MIFSLQSPFSRKRISLARRHCPQGVEPLPLARNRRCPSQKVLAAVPIPNGGELHGLTCYGKFYYLLSTRDVKALGFDVSMNFSSLGLFEDDKLRFSHQDWPDQ